MPGRLLSFCLIFEVTRLAQYQLNQKLLFDDETFQIESLTMPQVKIKLSATASRCLTLFIERQGETIDKDTLMHECWGQFGALVTEGSMWKNISQLRQAFQKLNIPHKVIVTVPRQGYTFSSQILVEKLDRVHPLPPSESADENVAPENDIIDEPEAVESESEPAHQAQISPPVTHVRSKRLPALMTALVVLNLVSATGFYLYKHDNMELHDFITSEQYQPITSQGDTHVYLQVPLNEKSVYAQEAVERFKSDKPQTVVGKPVNYLYINNVSSRSVSSYFLCDRPIAEKDNGCSAWFSLRDEVEK